MIKITLITLGKLKEKYLREASAEYEKRLSRYCKIDIVELEPVRLSEKPSQSEIDLALQKESEMIIKKIPANSKVYSLCVEGKQLSSNELAEKISGIALNGASKINFIIGSSHGLSDRVKEKCSLKLSFSKMTFPHQLFRVLLLEQIYRAFSINSGSKYHK